MYHLRDRCTVQSIHTTNVTEQWENSEISSRVAIIALFQEYIHLTRLLSTTDWNIETLHFITDLDYFKNSFFVFPSFICVCVHVRARDTFVLFLFCSLFNKAVSILRVVHFLCSSLPPPAFISNSCTKQFLRSYMFRLRIVAIIRDPYYKQSTVRW